MSNAQAVNGLFELSLKELLEIKVLVSTRNEESLQTVPSSITVFSRNQINNLGLDYLHELINYVPGFQSFRQGESSAEYYHSSRGHRSSTTSREVLVMIDGVRLNRELDNVFSVPMFSLHNVEKIEFIRGPGSALYGSNAVLGVIDITTTKDKNQLELVIGENQVRQLHAVGAGSLWGWNWNVAINAFDEGGENLAVQDQFTQVISQSPDPRAGEDIQISFSRNNTKLNLLTFDRHAEEFYISGRLSADNNFVRHRHQQMGIIHSENWNDTLKSEFTAVVSENSFEPESFFGTFLGTGKASVDEDNIDLNINNQWSYSSDSSLIFGLDFRRSDISDFELNTQNIGPIILYEESVRKITSAYLQNQNQFDSGTKLTMGVRYDHYNGIDAELSPRVAVVHPLTSSQSLKILYGEAFRAPTVNELFIQNSAGVVGNPDLQPETIKTSEIIWIKQWAQQVLTVNAFYNTIDHVISRDDTLAMPTFVNQSSPESFHGFELEYSLQWGKPWLLTVNASSFHNLPDSDFRQADTLASFIVNYSQDNWNFNLSGVFSSERHYLTGPTLQEINSFWQVNAKWRYKISDRLGFYLKAKNLLDKDYETPPQRSVFSLPIQNRGREASVGVQINF